MNFRKSGGPRKARNRRNAGTLSLIRLAQPELLLLIRAMEQELTDVTLTRSPVSCVLAFSRSNSLLHLPNLFAANSGNSRKEAHTAQKTGSTQRPRRLIFRAFRGPTSTRLRPALRRGPEFLITRLTPFLFASEFPGSNRSVVLILSRKQEVSRGSGRCGEEMWKAGKREQRRGDSEMSIPGRPLRAPRPFTAVPAMGGPRGAS